MRPHSGGPGGAIGPAERVDYLSPDDGEWAMKRRFVIWCFGLIPLLVSTPCWAQTGGGSGAGLLGDALRSIETNIWHIFGRVTTVRGEPLGDVTVRVDIGSRADSRRVLGTDLQGKFSTQYTLDTRMFRQLNVKLVASKTGYVDARETVDFGVKDETGGINIVMREADESPDQLSMATLIDTLAPRLRDDAAKHSGVEPGRKEFVQGCEELIERDNAARAVPLLSKVVERAPSCVECRLLLSLALFDAGSWAGATRQLAEAEKLNDVAEARQAEPALIAGILEGWRGEASVAAGFFQKALKIEPGNALALQEMGRVLIQQKNWEAADRYLEKALSAGAGEEARLLRVQTLLEEGDIAEAEREMDQYVGDRNPKDLPFSARKLYVEVQDRIKLAPYAKVKSVITQPPQELLKAFPELAGLRAASDQNELELVLKKTGEGVEAFFRDFPNTVSVEQVHQERLGKDGKVKASLDQEFQYLLVARDGKWDLGLEEHRSTPRTGRTGLGGLNQDLMLTTGFASVSLHFDPVYQDGASFRYLGRQLLDGEDLHVIAFAQEPATARTMERFVADDESALILIQGLAWIHPKTFQIVRLRTDLLSPQANVRLQRQTTEIQFREVSFKEVAVAFWLPEEVAVTVDWKGRVYRNMHRYSDFKLFNVEAKEERKTPAVPPPQDE